MTPKEKAQELVYKYWDIENIDFINSIECALIAVDELIKQVTHSDVGYWQEVKHEIQKL
jgi:hypothetical protein